MFDKSGKNETFTFKEICYKNVLLKAMQEGCVILEYQHFKIKIKKGSFSNNLIN